MSTIKYPLLIKGENSLQISMWAGAVIVCSIVGYFIIGQFLLPGWALPLPFFALFLGLYIIKSEALTLSLFILTVTLVQLKPEHGVFTIFDALAGLVIVATTVSVLFKKLFVNEKYFVGSNEYLIFLLYVVWISIIGINNLDSGAHLELWLRGISILAPLLVIPQMFPFIDFSKKSNAIVVNGTMILTLVICFIVSVVRLRSSFLEASYLFEVSGRGISLVIGPFMAFVFLFLYLIEKQRKKSFFYFWGLLLAIGTTILMYNRTWWILCMAGAILTFFIIGRIERKRFFALSVKLLVSGILIIGVTSIFFPFFRIIPNFLFAHLLTSSHLKTDPSLMGRYIEWRYVLATIKASPIVGYGVGNTYTLYNWFGGFFITIGYTHNGYFGTLLNGGIVGFILLFGSYLGFMRKGFVLLQTRILNRQQVAYLKVGLMILGLSLISIFTYNMFAHRDVLLYIGLIWGYFLYIDKTTNPHPATPTTLVAEEK